MNHPILTHLFKSGSAIAGTPGPAHAVQGTTGNGPLANPVTLSTTGPLNTGAGTGVIGSRLPQGGTTANPANEQPQPIDPAELDKAKLEAQQAQTQVQQAKAQQEMQKIEADHANKLRDMSGGFNSGFLQHHMSGLDSGLNKLLSTAMKSRLELGLAKRASGLEGAPQAGHPAPAPVGYKPLAKTRTGVPIAPGATPEWVHDGTGGVLQRNLWEAQQKSKINNLNAGNTAEGAPRPGAFMQDMATHFQSKVLPALRGQAPLDREIAPLGILDAKKDTSLAKWSPAWAVNRAVTGGANLLGSTIRGVGGHGVRFLTGATDMVRHSPELLSGDLWNKPVNESPFMQSGWHAAKNLAGLYLDRMPNGAGMALTGGATALEQHGQDKAQAAALAQAADAQKAKMNPEAAGASPTDGASILDWLKQIGPFLAPYTNTDWMRPHPPPMSRSLPSQIGAGGHAVRDLSSFIR